VLVCNEGYSSSLAARALQRLGLVNATDLYGGFQAWRALRPGPPSGRG
jgi:rhodanese-related sulfurtransferase